MGNSSKTGFQSFMFSGPRGEIATIIQLPANLRIIIIRSLRLLQIQLEEDKLRSSTSIPTRASRDQAF
jgi:hypothetical protein